MTSKTTNNVQNLNFATNTRAVLEIHAAPGISYNSNTFAAPAISTQSVRQPTPFTDFPLRGDTLFYTPLEISFIVTEDLENWKLAVNWMEGFTAPHTSEEWIKRKFEYSDATIFMYNSHNNLKVEIKFLNLTPIYVGALRFETSSEAVVELVCDMTFDYQSFEIIGVSRSPEVNQ